MDNPRAAAILQRMDSASERSCDVIVAGGGLNGPALALALAGAGLCVTVVDAAPPRARAEAAFDGRAYALSIASKRLLGAIDIWPRLADKAQPMTAVRASDGRAGEGASPFFLDFQAAEIEEGPVGFMVEDRHLYAAFLAAMEAHPAITLLPGQSVVAQAPGAAGITATLADGRTLAARLLVGADGRRSGSAERAGIRRQGWGYDQTALVAAIAHDRPHGGVAQQFFMPSGPLAILPLTGNRSSIVWSETTANAARIAALADADFLAMLRPRFGDFLGQIRLAGPRFSYPLSLSLAERYVAPRLALIGDAAHGVHPIAGQGLNLGLRDVAALAEVLALARRQGEDIGTIDVLERYQAWRRFDATVLALGMDTVNRVFASDNPLLRAGRDLGMGVIQALPGLRRGFMRQAAGLTAPPGTTMPCLLEGRRP